MTEEEYWFSAKACFACRGDLKTEIRKNRKVLVCKECGVPNASISKEI